VAKRRFALINSAPTVDLTGYLTAANINADSYTPVGTWDFSGATVTVPEATVTAHEAALSIAIGQVTGFTDNSTNWDTAYGWGNHASAGYAPTADPTFTGAVSTDHGTGGTGNASFCTTSGGSGTVVGMGQYAYLGNHYSSQKTWMANNAYVDPTDTVSDQMRYAVSHASYGHTVYEMAAGTHVWHGDSANVTAGAIITKQQLMSLAESGGVSTLELGVNGTTLGGLLRLYGTTASKDAELKCTNGNLHIDSAAGSQVYLNYYSNTGGVYIGAAGGFKATMTGQYGAVQTQGSTGGYGGINLDGYFAFMNSGSSHCGIYNDVNNEWMILCYPNSYVRLYHNNVATVQTTSTGARHSTQGAYYHNASSSYTSGQVTFSTSAATGGTSGDIWYQYT